VPRRRLCCDGAQLLEKDEMRHTIWDVGHTAGGISLRSGRFLFSEFWSSKFQGQGRVFLEIFKGLTKNAVLWVVAPCVSEERWFLQDRK
jgi:hypothetical protein